MYLTLHRLDYSDLLIYKTFCLILCHVLSLCSIINTKWLPSPLVKWYPNTSTSSSYFLLDFLIILLFASAVVFSSCQVWDKFCLTINSFHSSEIKINTERTPQFSSVSEHNLPWFILSVNWNISRVPGTLTPLLDRSWRTLPSPLPKSQSNESKDLSWIRGPNNTLKPGFRNCFMNIVRSILCLHISWTERKHVWTFIQPDPKSFSLYPKRIVVMVYDLCFSKKSHGLDLGWIYIV